LPAFLILAYIFGSRNQHSIEIREIAMDMVSIIILSLLYYSLNDPRNEPDRWGMKQDNDAY